jgi:hypothetical protein
MYRRNSIIGCAAVVMAATILGACGSGSTSTSSTSTTAKPSRGFDPAGSGSVTLTCPTNVYASGYAQAFYKSDNVKDLPTKVHCGSNQTQTFSIPVTNGPNPDPPIRYLGHLDFGGDCANWSVSPGQTKTCSTGLTITGSPFS